jgi:hypothetical protein
VPEDGTLVGLIGIIRSTLAVAPGHGFPKKPTGSAAHRAQKRQQGGTSMARALSITGFVALAIGLLWIGQGTGAITWPRSSFMINQLQWAGYGALLGAIGLILIWQGNR